MWKIKSSVTISAFIIACLFIPYWGLNSCGFRLLSCVLSFSCCMASLKFYGEKKGNFMGSSCGNRLVQFLFSCKQPNFCFWKFSFISNLMWKREISQSSIFWFTLHKPIEVRIGAKLRTQSLSTMCVAGVQVLVVILLSRGLETNWIEIVGARPQTKYSDTGCGHLEWFFFF